MSSPSAPKPTQSQLAEEAAQNQASAMLDQQENQRRKRLLNAAAGIRAFSGSALTRAAPSNTAGTAPAAPAPTVPGAGSFVAPRGGGGFGGSFTIP